MSKDVEYFEYLQERSLVGKLYKQYWLYPKLDKYLKGKVLDVGCGVGYFLKFRANNTVGVDINSETVNWCKKNGLDVHLMEKDILPFKDKMFDSVNLDNVLEHLEDPSGLLTEIHRVTGEAGIFIVGVPGRCAYDRDPDHKVFYSKDDLIKTITDFGFSLKKILVMPLNINWLDTRITQYCVYGIFKKIEKS
jgi:SAM-dependent methyltransferase